MKNKEQSLGEIIRQFSDKFIAQQLQQTGKLPSVEHDDDWPSPCETGAIDGDGFISWQPVKMDETFDFKNVEQALSLTIHPDVHQYFSHIYSEAIPATCSEGNLELLFAWNKADYERLQQNIIGHLLMKQKLKQKETIFFAVTDEEDINLVVKNDSGEVWVEPVGCEPSKFIANNLIEFIESLEF
ncbi:SecY-interacting protein [Thalassotalea sp. ND16A]|uniref:SecY-interacting protein n=1 Tax=Thalassotalea sp. ND16A TaxID=1535422 RepID=UPI00051A046D|nr:SecY-interacting protein [Thalassotalea sp. ND16A]KGJ90550.1 hypothetical protein ND16A_1946 [Thalassotalea sp. ND16A]